MQSVICERALYYGFVSRSRFCLIDEASQLLPVAKVSTKLRRGMAKAAPSNDNAALLSARARDWREGRRLRALELLASGYRPSEVARVLGVSPGAVSQWSKRARIGGAEALFRRKRHGRDARLTTSQLAELRLTMAARGGGQAWTTRQVAAIIEQKWGIQYSRAHVSRILKALGLPIAARAVASIPQITSSS